MHHNGVKGFSMIRVDTLASILLFLIVSNIPIAVATHPRKGR